MRPLWPLGIGACRFFSTGNPLGPKARSFLLENLWISGPEHRGNSLQQAVIVIHRLSSVFTDDHYIWC